MNRLVLVGLMFASIVALGVGEQLCTPDQWEGIEAALGGYIHHHHPGLIKEHCKVAYDAKNKRKASFIYYENNDYKGHFQMVVRYGDDNDDSGKVYVVDLLKDKCWTKTLKRPFKKCCLPADAKKVHDYVLGLEQGGLKVTGYSVKVKEMDVFLAVSKVGDNIVPVSESVRGRFMSKSFLQNMEFGNITPGIKNESIFDIPKQCKENLDESMTDYLMREQFILAI